MTGTYEHSIDGKGRLFIPIMQAAAPYPQKAYEQFYERFVDGMSAEDHIIKRYQQADSIEQFLDEAYDWIENHKDILI